MQRWLDAETRAETLTDATMPLRRASLRQWVVHDLHQQFQFGWSRHERDQIWQGVVIARELERIAADAGAPALLSPGGLLAIEIADCQRAAVIELARSTGQLEDIDVLKDHEGLSRVLTAQRRM